MSSIENQLAKAFYFSFIHAMGLPANANDFEQYSKNWKYAYSSEYKILIANFISNCHYKIVLIDEVNDIVEIYGLTGPQIPILRNSDGFHGYSNPSEFEIYPELIEIVGNRLTDIRNLVNDQVLLGY